jgi:hypothetical protein
MLAGFQLERSPYLPSHRHELADTRAAARFGHTWMQQELPRSKAKRTLVYKSSILV